MPKENPPKKEAKKKPRKFCSCGPVKVTDRDPKNLSTR